MSQIHNIKNVNANGDTMNIYREGWITMVFIAGKHVGSLTAYQKTADECKEELLKIMEPHVSEEFLRLAATGLAYKSSEQGPQG